MRSRWWFLLCRTICSTDKAFATEKSFVCFSLCYPFLCLHCVLIRLIIVVVRDCFPNTKLFPILVKINATKCCERFHSHSSCKSIDLDTPRAPFRLTGKAVFSCFFTASILRTDNPRETCSHAAVKFLTLTNACLEFFTRLVSMLL